MDSSANELYKTTGLFTKKGVIMMKVTKKNVVLMVLALILGYAEGKATEELVKEGKVDKDIAPWALMYVSIVTGLFLRLFRDK